METKYKGKTIDEVKAIRNSFSEEYFKTHERIPTTPLSPKVALKKGLGFIPCLLCGVIFIIIPFSN